MVIRRVDSGFVVFSKKGKRLSKVLSRSAAEKRLRQIEFFKRQPKSRLTGG